MKRLPLFDAICLSTSTICGLILIAVALTGCKFFGAEPSGPSSIERYFFDIQTNYVPRFVLATNTVWKTNVVVHAKENEVGVIVTHTNQLIIPTYSLITITQQVEAYTFTTKTNQTVVQGAGAIGNMVAPGSGGLVVGLLTAGLAAWAKLRSRKKTGDVLVQNIESILEFVDTVPNGSEYTSAIKHIIKKDQEDEGVREKVKVAMADGVDKSDAKSSAVDMQKSLTATTAATVKTIV